MTESFEQRLLRLKTAIPVERRQEPRRNPEREDKKGRKAALGSARQAKKSVKVGRVMAKLAKTMDRLAMERRFIEIRDSRVGDL